jgi:hypothetical protein
MSTYSTFDHLEVFRDGPVGWLVNDRPDVRNAMSGDMRDEFAVAWRELDADPDVRVIVHTGNGRDFQTGVDVSEIASDGIGFERYRQSMEDFDVHFTSWHQEVWKPVITAVNGICCGGGFHWVADADIVIAASDGGGDRGDRADEEDAGRGGDAHGVHGQVRTDGTRAGSRARDDLRDRRSARAAAGPGPRVGRDDRQELSCGHGCHEEGAVGCVGTRPH